VSAQPGKAFPPVITWIEIDDNGLFVLFSDLKKDRVDDRHRYDTPFDSEI
jgi:hypothetical protein